MGLFLVPFLAHKPYCFLVLLNLGQALKVSPRTLAWAGEGLQDMNGHLPGRWQNAYCPARPPSWKRKEPGPLGLSLW